ncbi:MAG: elongation factor G [Inquilinaceae bacterium]
MGGIQHPAAPRCVALVGPQSSGKTTLLESILSITGAIGRKGSVKAGTTVGDRSDEARARQISTETTIASTRYLDEAWTVLDCPGSVELAQDAHEALMVVDAAVIVCEPEPEKVVALAPLLHFLDDLAIPHLVFINKMDTATVRVRHMLQALQGVSSRPLILRQVPIRREGGVTGYVDLVSERAYTYKASEASDLIRLPESVVEREQEARQEMLEALADFDDGLMEQLLEDVQPAKKNVYDLIAADLADDLIVPVLLGAAEQDNGVRRLLKTLRHDVPEPATTAARLGLDGDGSTMAQVFKTAYVPHLGKLSLARVWRGPLEDGQTVGEAKTGGLFHIHGDTHTKVAAAETGEVVAIGRVDGLATGDLIDGQASARPMAWPDPPSPVYAHSVIVENRNEEVKLTAALQKLCEEDSALETAHEPDTGELLLRGQGDIHLQIAMERLRRRYNVGVTPVPPRVPYKETIRKRTTEHTRFKRQTGGHGQFADIHVEIRPLPRGDGFQFEDRIVGGAIPRQYIPGVEAGIRDALTRGPLGFPVVDVAVTLTDGQFHSVDSSEQAFRTAGRMAMTAALPKCEPVLLEPVHEVSIFTPNDFTAKAQRILSSRRGQILGFDARPGWPGWDEVKAHLPQADLHDLIIELRSLTFGVGSYVARYDHLTPVTGKQAARVLDTNQAVAS